MHVFMVNDRKVIITRNEIMHSGLLNATDTWQMHATRQKHRYLFETTILKQMIRKKGEHYNKEKIDPVYFFLRIFQLLLGKYVGNVKMTKLSRSITARHVRISPQYWERGLCTKIDLLGCGIGSSGNRKSKVAFG